MGALTSLAAEPARAALFLDLDGVLAPIAPRPADARVPAEARAELVRLSGVYGLVACVTGRPGEVARALIGVPSLRYAGQHGLELHPEAAAFAGRIHAFARETGWPDLELKPLTAALHYRRAEDRKAAHERLEQVAASAAAAGLRSKWGRFVLELLPPVEASKGTAVQALLAETGLRRALYAGDDVTDLDGFHALDGLDVAVRVAVSSPEGPPELTEEADVVVDSPAAFLDEVLRQL